MSLIRLNGWSLVVGVVFLVAAGFSARAQEQPAGDKSAADQPPAAAQEAKQPVLARVIEVHGDVKHAPLESSDYQPCKLDDEYPEQTKIITGVRSSIKLQIGDEEPYTCMAIDAVGKTLLTEAYKTADVKKVRVGVGYGRIRAGVAEGGLKSDFTVDSPVATLSKRGTWGFTLFYERDTDYFEIGLADRGLVEAINRVTGQRRTVHPKELVTQAMRSWLEQARFERNVPIPDLLGQGDMEVAFNRIEQDGLGVSYSGQGQAVLLNLSNQSARAQFYDTVRRGFVPGQLGPIVPPEGQLRAEGFFGSGRGDELLDVLIETNNPLAQQGFAKPGRYKFRREALQRWLSDYKNRAAQRQPTP